MSSSEQIGWILDKTDPLFYRETANVYATGAAKLLHRLHGVGLLSEVYRNDNIINKPEGWGWTLLTLSTLGSMTLTEVRQAAGDIYRDAADHVASMTGTNGDDFMKSFMVPDDTSYTHELWVPEEYRPDPEG